MSPHIVFRDPAPGGRTIVFATSGELVRHYEADARLRRGVFVTYRLAYHYGPFATREEAARFINGAVLDEDQGALI